MIERYQPPGIPPRHATELHGVNEPPPAAVYTPSPDEPDTVPASRGARRAAWITSLVVMGGVLGLAIIFVIKLVNGPVEAKATAHGPLHPPTVAPVTPTTNVLEGLNVVLSYPGTFDQMRRLVPDSSALEQYMLSSKSNYRRTIAVEVRPLPSGSLEDEGSYKMRLIYPDRYQLSHDKIGAEPVGIFTKPDNQERTLFWAHGGKVLIVAMTSSDTRDNLDDFMKVVKATARWRS